MKILATALKGLIPQTVALAAWLLASGTAVAADQYWNPATTAKAAGNGMWDTGVGAWANTTAGTNAPVPWVNGNNAFFTLNTGANIATVNGVSAGLLYFQGGTYTVLPGTGPLTLAGPLTNISSTVTFNADIALTADQSWEVRASTTVNGTLTGPYTLKKTGGSYLNISNANNSIGGLILDNHYVRAYGGGNSVGGPGAALTLGSPDQTTIAKLELYPLAGQSETAWAIGPVTANGFGEINFKSTSNAITNRVAFGDLVRTNRGVLSLRQETSNFEIRQYVTFSNANQIVVNGMLPPWVVTPASGDFLAYDGLVKTLAYKTTAPDTWTSADVVNNTATRTLAADAAVYALRVYSDLTVPSGITLTNASGGLLLIGKTLGGNGTVAAGPNDLIVYATSTSALYPRISANGLTVWGGGTLSVSNITWSGDTLIPQGILKSIIAENTVLDGQSINGLGEFIKDGPKDLTLLNSTGTVGKITLNGTGAFSLLNSRYLSLSTTALSAIVPITVSNSYFGTKATITTGTGNGNIPIQIVGSGVSGQSTILDCGNFGVSVGAENGSGNTLLVDGKGVTGGALITGISNVGNTGFAVGRGANSRSNRVVIANGGEVRDYESDTNRNNGIGVGAGSNGNRIEILGGNGFISTLYKSYPHVIGSGSATGNVVVVDGKGFPGSALWQAGGNTGMTVGSGAVGNALIITNGGIYKNSSVSLGTGGLGNRIAVVGTGSELTGDGANAYLRIGAGTYSQDNVLHVADGGVVKNFSKWNNCIGGAEQSSTGTSVGNKMIIAANGTVYMNSSGLALGRTTGSGSASISNQVLVTGLGATWNFSGQGLPIGAAANGSRADGNELRVEHGGYAVGSSIRAGSSSDTTAGTADTGNRLIVSNDGWVNLADTAYCGAANGSPASSGNRVLATTGGILQANKLIVSATNDNTIAATDGGIFQFTTTTPTITSLTPGDISINGGVISYSGQTVFVNVRGNQSGSQLVNMTWSGDNTLRLKNSLTTTASSQTYVFDPDLGSTNYFRLEMVDGTTRYRGMSGNTLTIGQSVGSGGEMLCSNTTASVEMPFVLNGGLTIFNSTLTLQQAAEINGDVFIDLDNLPPSGTALVAQGALTLGGSNTLHLNGAPVDGKVLMTCAGDLTGRFTVTGLSNDYTLAYGVEGPGTISLLHSPTIIVIR